MAATLPGVAAERAAVLMGVPANVKRGAAWLDEHEPGWEKRIDLNALDLPNGCACVLGQLHGDYDRAVAALGLSAHDAERLGFWKAGRQRWWQLTAGWMAEVVRRVRV